jgi:tryptophanase
MRAEVARIDSDLELQPRERSPGAWATSLGISATILNIFSVRRESNGQEGVDKEVEFLRITPDRVIQNMTQLAMKIRASAANYRQRNIDPQLEVTVNPKVKRAKEAVLRWRGVEAPDKGSVEPEQPPGMNR